MRTQVLALILSPVPLLALVACENTTAPHAPSPGEIRYSAESTGSASYVATTLPDGDHASRNHLWLGFGGNGGVFGSTDTKKAAKWMIDGSGNVSGPELLGTLPAPFEDARQWVTSVNTNGDAAIGYADIYQGGPMTPWLWADGVMRLLPIPEGATRAWALGINDAGAVVGQVDFDAGDYGAVWLPPYDTGPILLPRMEEYHINSARGITSTGIITGFLRGDRGDALVQWQIDQDGTVVGGPTILDGGDNLLLADVNHELDGVGVYHGGGVQLAALYRTETAQRIDLGTLGGHTWSRARGVTDRASDGTIRVAGFSGGSDDYYDTRAVLWGVDGSGSVSGPFDLGLPEPLNKKPSSRFESAAAYSVNSQSWVAGYSRRADGSFVATVWQPSQEDACTPHPKTGKCQ